MSERRSTDSVVIPAPPPPPSRQPTRELSIEDLKQAAALGEPRSTVLADVSSAEERQRVRAEAAARLASSRLPLSGGQAAWRSEEPAQRKQQQRDGKSAQKQQRDEKPPSSPPRRHVRHTPEPVPVARFRPPMPVHAYTAVFNSKVGTHQQVVGRECSDPNQRALRSRCCAATAAELPPLLSAC